MRRRAKTAAWLVATASAAMAAGCATTTGSKSAPQNWDGLELTPTKGVDVLYLRPQVHFKAYEDVLLDPVQIAFDKNWDPNEDQLDISRHVSASEIEEIKTAMATLFREAFSKELAKGGYKVVDQIGQNTLRVSAGLVDVYITALDPMSSGRSLTLTNERGRMTLVMEMRDGPTGQLLARVLDGKVLDNFGTMQITNRVTNSADFRLAVSSWAKRLREGLDRVRAGAGPAAS